ncbi:MAG: ABC transporter ATP-binding protein [Pseudomonadota bacterium]
MRRTRTITMFEVGQPVLSIRDLVVSFPTRHGAVQVVNGVDLTLRHGQTLGVVGESGCGKSMTARAILGITPEPGHVSGGRILFHEHDGDIDLTALPSDGRAIRSLRGDRIAMVFQEPMTSFSPVHTVGSQIVEAIRLHRTVSQADARQRAGDLLERVGIPDPRAKLDAYPFQLSGGMRQRAMIAMALACDPEILIADEPTTALDVTIQAQILQLLADLQRENGMAIMLITHNLGVVAQACDAVAVMYMGRVVEAAPTRDLLSKPMHPYTRGLLRSVPLLGVRREGAFEPIRGAVPGPGDVVSGCAFHSRCDEAMAGRCERAVPDLSSLDEDRSVRCFLHSDVREALVP